MTQYEPFDQSPEAKEARSEFRKTIRNFLNYKSSTEIINTLTEIITCLTNEGFKERITGINIIHQKATMCMLFQLLPVETSISEECSDKLKKLLSENRRCDISEQTDLADFLDSIHEINIESENDDYQWCILIKFN